MKKYTFTYPYFFLLITSLFFSSGCLNEVDPLTEDNVLRIDSGVEIFTIQNHSMNGNILTVNFESNYDLDLIERAERIVVFQNGEPRLFYMDMSRRRFQFANLNAGEYCWAIGVSDSSEEEISKPSVAYCVTIE